MHTFGAGIGAGVGSGVGLGIRAGITGAGVGSGGSWRICRQSLGSWHHWRIRPWCGLRSQCDGFSIFHISNFSVLNK
jgi:hypothetical protein